MPASLANLMLFFNALSVPTILPVAGALLYAPIIIDTPAFAATSAILLSYFSPVTSLIASAPAAISSFFFFDWDDDCLCIRRSRHAANVYHVSAILLHLPCCCCYFLLASLDRAFVEGFRAGIDYAHYFYH